MSRGTEFARSRPERRRRQFERRYGISLEVFDHMVLEQGGRCRICRRKADLRPDHCHVSGVLRGLLCHRCNIGLGMFKDNPVLLTRAIRYLMEE